MCIFVYWRKTIVKFCNLFFFELEEGREKVYATQSNEAKHDCIPRAQRQDPTTL